MSITNDVEKKKFRKNFDNVKHRCRKLRKRF